VIPVGTNDMELIVREVLSQMKATATMNLKLALALMEKVEAEAKRIGVKAVVAVSDASGRPVAIHCTDGAFIGSFDVALNKTYTAVAFQMSTAKLAELAAPGGSLYGIQHTNEGKVVIFGGGEPLYVNDVMIGAIGVSGGTAEQDTYLGAYGKNILKEVIACK
jgi:uncharacterized protein GlcG (DUF336 family)